MSLRDGVVVAGKPGAPTTVDAYEDFLCPVCGLFESQHADTIQQALNAGRITVHSHILNLLEGRSDPHATRFRPPTPGCARPRPGGSLASYHASLYGKQPEEVPPAIPSTSWWRRAGRSVRRATSSPASAPWRATLR